MCPHHINHNRRKKSINLIINVDERRSKFKPIQLFDKNWSRKLVILAVSLETNLFSICFLVLFITSQFNLWRVYKLLITQVWKVIQRSDPIIDPTKIPTNIFLFLWKPNF